MTAFSGDEYVKALKDWAAADIAESPRQGPDLGKFFFTASLGAVTVIVALLKGSGPLRMTPWLMLSLVLLAASMLVALKMVVPEEQPVGGSTNLQVLHACSVRRVIWRARLWIACWGLGVLAGGAAIVT